MAYICLNTSGVRYNSSLLACFLCVLFCFVLFVRSFVRFWLRVHICLCKRETIVIKACISSDSLTTVSVGLAVGRWRGYNVCMVICECTWSLYSILIDVAVGSVPRNYIQYTTFTLHAVLCCAVLCIGSSKIGSNQMHAQHPYPHPHPHPPTFCRSFRERRSF